MDLCTLACGIREKKSVSLHVPVNWHPNTGLSTFEPGLDENRPKHIYTVTPTCLNLGHTTSFSRLSSGSSRVSSLPRGILKSLQLKPSPQGSWRVRSESLLPFLTIVDTTNKLTVSLVNTDQAQRDRVCSDQSVKNTPEISHLHSQ